MSNYDKFENKEKKIELKIEIKDFGPISSGNIILKPFTLFIGPNNSGKSYAAMLIHSLFESYPPISHKWSLFNKKRPFFINFFNYPTFTHIFDKELHELEDLINDLEKKQKLEIPVEFIQKVGNKIFEEIFEKKLSEEISRSYACPLNKLIRIGKKCFELRINFDSYNLPLICENDKLKIKNNPNLNIKIKLTESSKSFIITDIKESENEFLIEISKFFWEDKRGKNENFSILFNIILYICIYKIFNNIAVSCYYLPAARSGILQGHKALAASIVKNAAFGGIERWEIPKLSGTVSDFISSVITLPEKKGPFYQITQEFEKELLKGQIIFQTLDEYSYPEFKYKFRDSEIPLYRASSTVSELAPLFLYLKYKINPNNVLIIEEPEAHLHPENQRILAKLLVRLIRKGIYLVITTHSEYLLEQLSSFIMLSKIEPHKRVEKYKYGKEDFLKSNEIAVYLFDYDKDNDGYKIEEVEITEEDGISQEEFIKIHESLYEETLKLRRDLNNK
ncbi:MAG: AAA family ATPase [Candidatus Helarchaeota archaeon]